MKYNRELEIVKEMIITPFYIMGEGIDERITAKCNYDVIRATRVIRNWYDVGASSAVFEFVKFSDNAELLIDNP